MARGKTLRRVRKPLKKNILKGGQGPIKPIDYKNIQDTYAHNLDVKKELYNTIQKEGNIIYDYETSNANTNSLTQVNTIVSFIQEFHNNLETQIQNKKDDFDKSYTSYFVIPNANMEIVLAESQENLLFVQNIQQDFSKKQVHLHLVSQRLDLLNNAKEKTNSINKKFLDVLSSIDSIFKIIENEKDQKTLIAQADSQVLEEKKTSLINAIALVNRIPPDGFVANQETPFIQGCPLGTILENGLCVYKNNDTVLETVPFQESLTNTDNSDFLIWFDSINQQAVGNPVVFKRKPLQYVAALTLEDAKLYNKKYVVCESNGALYKDSNGYYKFIDTILTNLNLPGFTNYYIDYDSIPQAVQIINNPAPIIRSVETQNKYISLLKDIDQVLSGVQYIETDEVGNFSSIIPFFPDYYDFEEENNIFTKLSYNNVDTLTYKLVSNINKPLYNSSLPKAVLDTTVFDPNNYNVIPNIYLNKYTEVSTNSFYNPFVLPQFFVDSGDFFMFHNIGNNPIIFDISSTSEEKRVLLYPKQIICFVSSNNSPMLSYGFLFFDRIITTQTKSSYVSKVLDTYIFVNDNNPLTDSEGNLISVPNLDLNNSLYYDFDDIFETNPHSVTIKDSLNIQNPIYSQEFLPYSSSYITFVHDANIFVFSDISGNPNLDILGYFIPVPSPIHYTNNSYIWYCLDKQKQISIVNTYNGIINIDDNYDYSIQFQSAYSTTLNNISVYVNSVGIPLVSNKNVFITTDSPTTNLNIQIWLPQDFIIAKVNISVSTYNIRSARLLGLIKLYGQNIVNLQNYYKDISGNMNNLGDLQLQLNDLNNTITTIRDINQLDKYETTLKTIYDNVLKTKNNLQDYFLRMEQKKIYDVKLSEVKNLRLNELSAIQDKINSIQINMDNAKTSLIPLNDNDLNNDYETLNASFTQIKQTYTNLNTNVNSSQDYTVVEQLEKSTKIVLNTLLVLEKNIAAFQQSIVDKENILHNSLLNDKQSQLLTLAQQIESTDIQTLESQYNNLKDEEIKQQYATSLQNIKQILDNVAKDKLTIVTYTNDTIDKQIELYKGYLDSISLEKQKIQTYLNTIASKVDNEVLNNKNILIQAIAQFEDLHENINTLLSSLVLTDEQKQKYETEILDNYNTINGIKLSIPSMTNNDSILADIKRVNELISLDEVIQKDLQTIELTPAVTPAVTPDVTPTLTIGGKKHRKTRKFRKSIL